MAITFRMLSRVLPMVTATKKPVLLRSRHGVGKSSCVYAYAEMIGMPVVERRASQMTEGDLLGLPKVNKGVTEWLPPAWFKRSCDEAVVLFIDEIDRATMEVRQGFFELTDSRKLAGYHLHPDTLIFAAINGGEFGQQYQVGEMDPAELDRWTVFDVEPDIEDWLTWAKSNCHDVVWDFINQNHVHLEHNTVFEPNKVYPSRRSWHRLSECLQINNDQLVKRGEYCPELAAVATAFVGLEASVAVTDFIKNLQKQVNPEDILYQGNFKLVEKFELNDHVALIEKMKAKNILINSLDDTQIDYLVKYFNSLPSEAAMLLFDGLKDNTDAGPELFIRIYGKIKAKVIRLLNADEPAAEEPTMAAAAPAKKRGRPAGSKNKKR